jgi:hypothetical protein
MRYVRNTVTYVALLWFRQTVLKINEKPVYNENNRRYGVVSITVVMAKRRHPSLGRPGDHSLAAAVKSISAVGLSA